MEDLGHPPRVQVDQQASLTPEVLFKKYTTDLRLSIHLRPLFFFFIFTFWYPQSTHIITNMLRWIWIHIVPWLSFLLSQSFMSVAIARHLYPRRKFSVHAGFDKTRDAPQPLFFLFSPFKRCWGPASAYFSYLSSIFGPKIWHGKIAIVNNSQIITKGAVFLSRGFAIPAHHPGRFKYHLQSLPSQ